MADLLESRQSGLVALSTVMLSVAIIAVVLRFWSNYVSRAHRFGYDDLFALLALPCVIIESALIFWWVHLGLGRHAATLPTEEVLMGPKIVFIATFFYLIALTFPKFSVLFFYHRIFDKNSTWFHYSLWTIGSLNGAYLITTILLTILQCIPIQAAWDPAMAGRGARCMNTGNWFFGTAIPSTIIDFFILIAPMPLLWNLKTPWHRRAVVIGIFICGYSVIITSIGRLVVVARAGSSLGSDYTWSTIDYIGWVQCEAALSVTSVSLPNIAFLARRIHEKGLKGVLPGDDPIAPVNRASKPSNTNPPSKFIRLDPYDTGSLGNSTLVSAPELHLEYVRGDVNVTREVDVTGHGRHETV